MTSLFVNNNIKIEEGGHEVNYTSRIVTFHVYLN